MKSYLIALGEPLLKALRKFWAVLETGWRSLEKDKALCKRIIILLLVSITWVVGARYGVAHVRTPEPADTKIRQVKTLSNKGDFSQHKVQRSEREENLTAISKVLYGYRYNSERDLEGIVWVILNRVDNQSEFKGFSTIQDVVNQPSQWMGYSENNPVIEDLWEIADTVLTRYETDGKRLFGQEYLYFEWRSDYIVFKTELYDSKTCKMWRAY